LDTKTTIRILLVEDSPTDVLLARALVDTYPEFQLQHVERLRDAIRTLEHEETDVVLLDLGLPDSQGLETLERLLAVMPEIPIVVMTGRDDEETALEAVHVGAQDYLVKSRVPNGVLGRSIRYAIERHRFEQSRRERAAIATLHAEVSLAFTSADGLHSMMQACTDSLIRNLDGAIARIWMFERSDQTLHLCACSGLSTSGESTDDRVSIGAGTVGGIALRKNPWMTNDLRHSDRGPDLEWAELIGLNAYAGFPLLLDGVLLGVLEFFSQRSIAASQSDAVASVANLVTSGAERKAKEEAFRRSEQRFQQLMEHIHEVLWLIDLQKARILYVSAGYEKMWGRTCASLLNNADSYLDAVHPDDFLTMMEKNATMRFTGQMDTKCRVVQAQGDVRWVRLRCYPIMEMGQLVSSVGVMEDITDTQRLAAERDELLARQKLYIQRLPLAYVLFDASFRVIDWNPAASRIFGYTRAEVLGQGPPFESFVPPSAWQQWEDTRHELRSGNMQAHLLSENRTRDGRIITCQWFNTPLREEDGDCVGYLCLAQDVTDRRNLETQLRHAQKMEAIGLLAGGIAHDFNNLLTIINGYSELILTGVTPETSVRDLVSEIADAGRRAASLTRRLLSFSRSEVEEPRVINMNTIVFETARMLRRLIAENIIVHTRIDASVGWVKADAGQIEQVLLNLAVNARDAMPHGGCLTISTANEMVVASSFPDLAPATSGLYVILTVADTGQGMDPKTRARMFEPFFTTKDPGKGTGLGLATVFGIVKQNEGQILVESEPGEGSKFRIYLPCTEDPATSIQCSHQERSSGGTETVLLVEDEPAVRKLARWILEKHGYTVLEAVDGESALEIARDYSEAIHLLVTDIVMPGINGRELAERLTVDRTELRVLFLTGYTDDAIVRHGVSLSEAAFLQKPFTPDSLEKKVREVLNEQR
jgi:PAS domain S-box-containing protein